MRAYDKELEKAQQWCRDHDEVMPGKHREQSSWFRGDRVVDSDRLDDFEAQPLWTSSERPPDAVAAHVRNVLARMKPDHRQVIEDRYFLDMSVGDIAEERACTRSAVRSLLMRAVHNFKKEMQRETGYVPKEAL